MYTKEDLAKHIQEAGVDPKGILLIHSSMKAVGDVEGRAETVLDAFIEYMKEGLLIFPTHSWDESNLKDNRYDPSNEPSCVGILSNLFLKRKGVVRSLHPTHSIAALGRGAEAFAAGEEAAQTPCPETGCWHKLYERDAQILFLGAPLTTNTFIHGVEEWNNIPNRIHTTPRYIEVINPAGENYTVEFYGHHSPTGDVSKNYDKLKSPVLERQICRACKIGDADSWLCQAKPMADLTASFLKRNPNLFADDSPIPELGRR